MPDANVLLVKLDEILDDRRKLNDEQTALKKLIHQKDREIRQLILSNPDLKEALLDRKRKAQELYKSLDWLN